MIRFRETGGVFVYILSDPSCFVFPIQDHGDIVAAKIRKDHAFECTDLYGSAVTLDFTYVTAVMKYTAESLAASRADATANTKDDAITDTGY